MAKETKDKAPKKKVKLPTAIKRHLQSLKKNERNRAFKASVKTAIRHFEEVVEKRDETEIKLKLNEVYSLLDKGVKTNKFKLNKASRTKSRLANRAVILPATK